jgi:hypothetical protein
MTGGRATVSSCSEPPSGVSLSAVHGYDLRAEASDGRSSPGREGMEPARGLEPLTFRLQERSLVRVRAFDLVGLTLTLDSVSIMSASDDLSQTP